MLAFLFFLLVAFIFWLMLFFQKQNIEGTYRVPLKYTNIPEDVVFDNPLPAYIDVSVSDNGAEIFRLDIRKKDSLEIDFAALTEDRKSTRLNSSHVRISYAVFCLKKKNNNITIYN